MGHLLFLLMSLLTASASAQSTNIISVIISEGYSIFTSIVGNTATNTANGLATSATPTTLATSASAQSGASTGQSLTSIPSSVASSISSQAASQSSSVESQLSSALASISSQASAQSSSNTASSTSSGTAAAASSTSTAGAGANSGSNHNRTLAIALGTVLGALALGLLLLLLLILCRRRRRRATGVRNGSLTSASDEALTTHKTPLAHTTPAAAALASRNSRSFNRRSNEGVPVMSERAKYDVPSAHEFGGHNTAPFVPSAGDARTSSGIIPTSNNNGLVDHNRSHVGTGLNSHPYEDNFHPGAMLAAGAGGAALGTAASRHSRSGERRYSRRHSGESATKRLSRSGERHHDPIIAGDPNTHPAFWDEPHPPRSPHRSSIENARRRSGSMPRNALPGSHNHTNSPLRDDMSAVAAGGLAGATTGALANRGVHRDHERGRTLPQYDSVYGSGADGLGPDGMPTMPTQSTNQRNHNSFVHSPSSATPAAALGGAAAMPNQSHLRSGGYPPVPSSLTTADPNLRRSLPSRSPKRTRFATGEPYQEPMPYDSRRRSGGGVSPPLNETDPRNSTGNPFTAGAPGTDHLVSPISPESTARGFGYGMPAANARPNLIDRPRSRSPDFVHTVHLPTTTTVTTIRSKPRPQQPRQNSGLVDAVQDQFNPNQANTTANNNNNNIPNYEAYRPPSGTMQSSGFPGDDSTTTNRTSKPLSRKPVATSPYNNPAAAPGPPQPHMTGNRKSEDDAWWRGQEDSAWRESYTPTNENRTSADNYHAR